MKTFRISLKKTVIVEEFYLIEAADEESAVGMAMDAYVLPEATDEISSEIENVNAEEIE